jgi:putative membrane protein insertion efficiency factor
MNYAAKYLVLRFLRAYKWLISPLLPPSCRYVPSCSEYGMEAVERYGALRGGAMAIWRVLRCHPFVKGGFDPVPLHAPPKQNTAADFADHRGSRLHPRVF